MLLVGSVQARATGRDCRMQRTDRVALMQAVSAAPSNVAGRAAPARHAAPAGNAAAGRMLDLQRTHGNAFVQRMIQCKLSVSDPGDAYEREADIVADVVVRSAERPVAAGTINPKEEPEGTVRRMCADCQEELGRQVAPPEEEDKEAGAVLRRRAIEEEEREPETLSAKSAPGGGAEVSEEVEAGIQHLSGGGAPLAPPVRAEMESSMGFDFSGVRVHHDGHADHLARSVNALAFTHGRDIVFGGGQYQPATPAGKRLLAHELTHVVQQTGGVPVSAAEETVSDDGARR